MKLSPEEQAAKMEAYREALVDYLIDKIQDPNCTGVIVRIDLYVEIINNNCADILYLFSKLKKIKLKVDNI